jgi:homocysteine S-methyltransferase
MDPTIAADRITVLDGGLSSALEQLGVDLRHDLWTARLLLEEPELLVEAHARFARAGAEVLITASYQAGLDRLTYEVGSLAEARSVLASTTSLAREAFVRVGVEGGRVAASLGPYGALLADGSEYSGDYGVPWRDVRRTQRDRLEVLVETEPDWIAIETVPTRAEADTSLEALLDFPQARAWVAFTCRNGEHTWGGDPIEEAAVLAASSPQVVAVGVNCTDPRYVEVLLDRISSVTSLPLVAYPNHGRAWDATTGTWVGVTRRLAWDEWLPAWFDQGARLVGGCCGVGPDQLAPLAEVAAEVSLGSGS